MLLIIKDHLIPNCNKNCPRLLNMLWFLGSHAVALGQCWKKILGFICWYCDSQCRTLSSVSFGELLNYLRKLTVDSSHDWCLLTSSLPEAQPKKWSSSDDIHVFLSTERWWYGREISLREYHSISLIYIKLTEMCGREYWELTFKSWARKG